MPLFLVKWDAEPPEGFDDDERPADGEYDVPEEALQSDLDSKSPYWEWFDGEGYQIEDIPEAEIRCAKAADYLSDGYGWWLVDGIAEYDKGIGNREVPPDVDLLEDAGMSDVEDAQIHPYQVPGLDPYGRRYTVIKKWYCPSRRAVFYLMHIDRTKRPTGFRWRGDEYKPWKNIWALRAAYTTNGIGDRLIEPDLSTGREVSSKTYGVMSWNQCPPIEKLDKFVEKEVASLATRWRGAEYQ